MFMLCLVARARESFRFPGDLLSLGDLISFFGEGD